MRIAFCRGVACARLSDSIRSGNVLKAKLRRARLGKGGGGGGKNAALSLSSPRAFFAFLITERLSTTISEPGTGYHLGGVLYFEQSLGFLCKVTARET